MAKKYYLICPNCRARLRRTGKKDKEIETLNGSWLYIREYECPNCGAFWVYSEYRSIFIPGRLKDYQEKSSKNI